MNILDNVTLVIPTHYRHHYLNRILSYYKDMDIKILVADSTDVAFKYKDNFKIDYFHYPDGSLSYKIQDIVSKVNTPYMFFCADDDFWIKESIEPCMRFLKINNNYSSVQGRYIRFSSGEDSTFTPSYLHAKSIEYDEIDKRLNADMGNYMPLFYAMHRTEVISRVLNDNYNTNVNHAILVELSVSFYSLVYGKHKLLEILTYARDNESPATSVNRDYLEDISENKKYKKEYEQFKYNISKFIHEQDSKLNANEIIENALAINISKRKRQSPRATVLKLIYSLFPMILKIRKKLKIKRIFRKLSKAKGYPISDEKAIASWNEIKNIIKKYAV